MDEQQEDDSESLIKEYCSWARNLAEVENDNGFFTNPISTVLAQETRMSGGFKVLENALWLWIGKTHTTMIRTLPSTTTQAKLLPNPPDFTISTTFYEMRSEQTFFSPTLRVILHLHPWLPRHLKHEAQSLVLVLGAELLKIATWVL